MVTERQFLCASTGDEMPESVKSLLFGALMDRTVAAVTQHRSDFYHDALFIHHRDREELEAGFYYAFGDLGTITATEKNQLIYREHRYHVRIEREVDTWYMVLTEV